MDQMNTTPDTASPDRPVRAVTHHAFNGLRRWHLLDPSDPQGCFSYCGAWTAGQPLVAVDTVPKEARCRGACKNYWPSELYEFDPDWCIRPGVHLRELMDYSGLKGSLGVRMIAKLAQLDEATVEGILSGETLITEDIAAHLAAGTQPLAISAQFWLNLERSYREGLKVGRIDVSADYDRGGDD